MTPTTSLSSFCNWLMSESANRQAPCAIALHGLASDTTDKLISDIASYLNEYDEHGSGQWLGASDDLVTKAASDPCNRGLLGLDPSEADDDNSFLQSLTALSTKGDVVFRWPSRPWAHHTPKRVFHAGIGNPDVVKNRCHIIIDPDLIPASAIAHIIGDIFLDWSVSRSTANQSLKSLR